MLLKKIIVLSLVSMLAAPAVIAAGGEDPARAAKLLQVPGS